MSFFALFEDGNITVLNIAYWSFSKRHGNNTNIH